MKHETGVEYYKIQARCKQVTSPRIEKRNFNPLAKRDELKNVINENYDLSNVSARPTL